MKNQLCLLIFFSLIFEVNLHCQYTFNKRYFEDGNALFTSIEPLPNGNFLAKGTTVDSLPDIHKSLWFATVNEIGDMINWQSFGDSSHQFSTGSHSYSKVPGLYLQVGQDIRNGFPVAILTWCNSDGDTIRTREYLSPSLDIDYPQTYEITGSYSLMLPDSSVLLAAQISNTFPDYDVCIWYLDEQGGEIWHRILGGLGAQEGVDGIVQLPDSTIALALNIYHPGDVGPQVEIIKMNLQNEILAEFNVSLTDGLPEEVNALLHDDGSLYLAGSSLEYNKFISNPKFTISKISEEGDALWTTNVGAEDVFYWNRLNNVVLAPDGNILCAGTYNLMDEGYATSVCLVKVNSVSGEIIWERYYEFVENTTNHHFVYDLRNTLDNGIVFCGSVNELVATSNDPIPLHQGWIVKLDECGCLVPGCDENCSTASIGEESDVNWLLYPNPASTSIGIHISAKLNGGENLENITIHDVSGKLWKCHPARKMEMTYMLDVADLPNGQYVISLNGKKGSIKQEVLQVAH